MRQHVRSMLNLPKRAFFYSRYVDVIIAGLCNRQWYDIANGANDLQNTKISNSNEPIKMPVKNHNDDDDDDDGEYDEQQQQQRCRSMNICVDSWQIIFFFLIDCTFGNAK